MQPLAADGFLGVRAEPLQHRLDVRIDKLPMDDVEEEVSLGDNKSHAAVILLCCRAFRLVKCYPSRAVRLVRAGLFSRRGDRNLGAFPALLAEIPA